MMNEMGLRRPAADPMATTPDAKSEDYSGVEGGEGSGGQSGLRSALPQRPKPQFVCPAPRSPGRDPALASNGRPPFHGNGKDAARFLTAIRNCPSRRQRAAPLSTASIFLRFPNPPPTSAASRRQPGFHNYYPVVGSGAMDGDGRCDVAAARKLGPARNVSGAIVSMLGCRWRMDWRSALSNNRSAEAALFRWMKCGSCASDRQSRKPSAELPRSFQRAPCLRGRSRPPLPRKTGAAPSADAT